MPALPLHTGTCWRPTPLVLVDRSRKRGFRMPWRPALALELRRAITECSGHSSLSLHKHINQTLPNFASPSCSGKISDLGKGDVLFHTVTLTCQAPHKSGFPAPPWHSQTHFRDTCLDLLHTSYYSIHRSSRLLTWGLTHFPVYSRASTLIPNVLNSFSGNDLCLPFD